MSPSLEQSKIIVLSPYCCLRVDKPSDGNEKFLTCPSENRDVCFLNRVEAMPE